jgi:hypothetical protein
MRKVVIKPMTAQMFIDVHWHEYMTWYFMVPKYANDNFNPVNDNWSA